MGSDRTAHPAAARELKGTMVGIYDADIATRQTPHRPRSAPLQMLLALLCTTLAACGPAETDLRVAFSCLEVTQVRDLFETVHTAIGELRA